MFETAARLWRRVTGGLGLLLALAGAAGAEDRAGDFDYYVLAVTWRPAFCAAEGSDAPFCGIDGPAPLLTLHGLWPQYEKGWPEHCAFGPTKPGATGVSGLLMGGAGPAAYQWRKHGRCAGLSPETYFSLAGLAFLAVSLPPAWQDLKAPRQVTVGQLAAEFQAVNPGLSPDSFRLICRDGALRELRLCLDKDLEPRACARDVGRACRGEVVLLPP